MNIDNWLAFVLAYTVISLIPGPSVLMVVSQALTHGKKAAFTCIVGDLLGGVVIILLSLLGLGAVLATSALAFGLLKWLGVGYLAYLGIQQIRGASGEVSKVASKSFRSGFLVGLLNPKAIIFYMVFLAQFIDQSRSVSAQIAILIPTATVVVAGVLGGYALLAARASAALQRSDFKRKKGYASGGLLLSGSAMLAARG